MSDETTASAAAEQADERSMRRARRQALRDAGIDPYPARSAVTDHAAELEERYANLDAGADTKDVVCVGGRIRAIRNQGKVAFIVLEDSTAQIQLFCRVNVLGDGWALLD